MTKRTSAKNGFAGATGIAPFVSMATRHRKDQQRGLLDIERHSRIPRNDLLPQLTLVERDIDALKTTGRRVRSASPLQDQRISASLEAFGLCAPILINSADEIIEGHAVWRAMRQNGATRISCIVIDHLTSTQQRALHIALNRLGETGDWDVDELRIELQELVLADECIMDLGFSSAEVDVLLLDDEEAEEDCVPPAGGPPVSQPGSVWRLGSHVLTQGDAREAESYRAVLKDGEQARFVLTDPPYNVPNFGHVTGNRQHRDFAMAHGEMNPGEFLAFNKAWITAALAYLADGGLMAPSIDWRGIEVMLGAGRECELELLNLIVWSKSNAGMGSLWRSQHELLPIFKLGSGPHTNNVELGRYGRARSNVWEYAGASTIGSDARDGLSHHPTVKPRKMLEDALLDVTNRGDIVIDCFAGSGSTLLAAETTGRSCRAIEIDGTYCDLIIRRWEALTGKEATDETSGETFKQVAAACERNGRAQADRGQSPAELGEGER